LKIELRRVDLPDFDVPLARPSIPVEEYEQRSRDLYDAVGLDWVAIYGDREHNANLLHVSGFDPRFEEALLLLGPDERRVLLVGNEGLTHAQESRLPVEVVLYQPFSLMGQPRGTSPRLDVLLQEAGITQDASIGVTGWKYLSSDDVDEPRIPAYVPAFLLQALDRVSGRSTTDVTASLMDPNQGLRNRNSAGQIAQFEWGAARASAAVMRIVRATQPGMTELEAAQAMGYAGEPLSCHAMFSTSDTQLNGLRSPSGRSIGQDEGVTVGIGYWGGLCCRAGVISETPDEEFFADYVRPYYAAVATWWMTLRVGVSGGQIYAKVIEQLQDAPIQPALNPGHLGSYDEWVHSPVYLDSDEEILSGMVIQCDIIPTPLPDGRGLNCEDTVAIADEALRDQIASQYPEVWARIVARRQFMQDALGIQLQPEVLPLSTAPAYLPPFWLSHDLVCTISG
jgi:hypothetical protein